MPCDAIATTRARVPNADLVRLIGAEALQNVLAVYLQNRFPQARIQPFAYPTEQYPAGTAQCFVILPDDIVYDTAITADGVVTVGSRDRDADTAALTALRDDLLALVIRAGAVRLQQRAAAWVGSRFPVTEARMTPEGDYVVEFEV
jgi:hypothetical protein